MIDKELENLINATLIDNELSPKEKEILIKKAQSLGISREELESYLNEKMRNAGAANTSSKRGTVKHCPACGAVLNSYQVQCPKCGYVVDEVDANKSVRDLSDAIREAKTLDERKLVIKTFPVPNTKATLLELLTFLKPKVEDRNDPCYEAYYQKYQECVEKSKVSFKNDADFQSFFNDEKNLKKEKKSYDRADWAKRNYKMLLIALGVIVGVVVLAVDFHEIKEKNQEVKIAEELRIAEEKKLKREEFKQDSLFIETINKDLENDNYEKVINDLLTYRGPFSKIKDKYIRTIKKLLRENYYNEAKILLIQYPEMEDGFSYIKYEYEDLLSTFDYQKDYESAADMILGYPQDFDNIKDIYEKTVTDLLNNNALKAERLYLKWKKEPQLFYQHFLESGDYEKAKGFYFADKDGTDANYYSYLSDCVTDMCEKGQFDVAEDFITANAAHFKRLALSSKKMSRRKVKKQLNAVVKKYKKSQKKGLFGRKKDKK